MTSIAKLKIAAGCGEPDSVRARMLDVVIAAEAFYDALDLAVFDQRLIDAQLTLESSVEKLRKARKARAGG